MSKRLNFDDLGVQVIDAEIIAPDGKTVTIGVKTLSEVEVDEINASVAEPAVPTRQKLTKTGYVEEKFPEDPEYIKKVRAAGRERMYRVLAAGLDMDIPGTTLAEKSQALQTKKVASWIVIQAMTKINEALGINPEEVKRRAEAFQSAAESDS